MKAQFNNTAEPPAPHFTGFANELAMNADGWAQLAPFGDFPGRAVITNSDGTVTRFDAIQRLDRAAADAMVRNFYSLGNRVKRFFKSCAIFNGHPDMPDAGGRYPDKSPKGVIADLRVSDEGLFCRPLFNNEGEALLNQPARLFFSGRWTSTELPTENGRRIFRPDELKSAGLTANPNLPVEHINDRSNCAAVESGYTSSQNAARPPSPSRKAGGSLGEVAQSLASNPSTINTEMNKQPLLQLLAAYGVQFTNDAGDQQLLDALAQTLASLAGERDAARNQFASERKSRIASLLDGALTEGRITAGQRSDWERRLGDDAAFANESTALTRLPKIIKTASILEGAGQRKIEIANAGLRADAVQTLVKVEMERAHCDYPAAFARVREANPALFAEMKEPKLI
jgi:hypothetical protein